MVASKDIFSVIAQEHSPLTTRSTRVLRSRRKESTTARQVPTPKNNQIPRATPLSERCNPPAKTVNTKKTGYKLRTRRGNRTQTSFKLLQKKKPQKKSSKQETQKESSKQIPRKKLLKQMSRKQLPVQTPQPKDKFSLIYEEISPKNIGSRKTRSQKQKKKSKVCIKLGQEIFIPGTSDEKVALHACQKSSQKKPPKSKLKKQYLKQKSQEHSSKQKLQDQPLNQTSKHNLKELTTNSHLYTSTPFRIPRMRKLGGHSPRQTPFRTPKISKDFQLFDIPRSLKNTESNDDLGFTQLTEQLTKITIKKQEEKLKLVTAETVCKQHNQIPDIEKKLALGNLVAQRASRIRPQNTKVQELAIRLKNRQLLERIKRLILSGVEVITDERYLYANSKRRYYYNALFDACKAADLELAKFLLPYTLAGGQFNCPHKKEILFKPGRIGLNFIENRVSKVFKRKQADKLGVRVGWRVISINGIVQSNNAKAIIAAIKGLSGKSVAIVFDCSQDVVILEGTETWLHAAVSGSFDKNELPYIRLIRKLINSDHCVGTQLLAQTDRNGNTPIHLSLHYIRKQVYDQRQKGKGKARKFMPGVKLLTFLIYTVIINSQGSLLDQKNTAKISVLGTAQTDHYIVLCLNKAESLAQKFKENIMKCLKNHIFTNFDLEEQYLEDCHKENQVPYDIQFIVDDKQNSCIQSKSSKTNEIGKNKGEPTYASNICKIIADYLWTDFVIPVSPTFCMNVPYLAPSSDIPGKYPVTPEKSPSYNATVKNYSPISPSFQFSTMDYPHTTPYQQPINYLSSSTSRWTPFRINHR